MSAYKKEKRASVFGKSARTEAESKRLGAMYHKASHCLQQMQFTTEATLKENSSKFAKIEEKGIDMNKVVLCPFCLVHSKIRFWVISGKKGYDRGKGQCPECGNNVQYRTLLTKLTSPEQYANFAYPYAKSGFWQKIKNQPNHPGKDSFPSWKENLAKLGWTQRFCDEYKRLKGENTNFEEQEGFNRDNYF